MRRIAILSGLAALLLALAAGPMPARAQDNGADAAGATATAAPGALAPLVAEAGREGLRVVLLVPGEPAPAAGAAGDGPDVLDVLAEAETGLRGRLAGLGGDVAALPAALGANWPDGGAAGLLRALAACALALLAGWLAERGLARLLRPGAPRVPQATGPAARHARLLGRFAAGVAGTAVQIGTAAALILLIWPAGAAERWLGYAVIVAGAGFYRLAGVLADLALPPPRDAADAGAGTPGHPLRPGLMRLALLIAVALALRTAIARLGLGTDLGTVFEAGFVVVGVAAVIGFLWLNRAEITRAAFGSSTGLLTRLWPTAVSAYLLVAAVVRILPLLRGMGEPAFHILAPLYAAVPAVIGHSVAMVLLSRRGPGGRAAAAAAAEPDAEPPAPPRAGRDPGGENAFTLALALWAGLVLWGWGVPLLNAAEQVHSAWVILAIAVAARIGWTATAAWFDRRIAEQGGPALAGEPGDEGGGKGSRLGTLLPLMRSALLALVAALAGMTALAELGVNIAPLFAGAGLIGFAIGFGAQSLVRDVFSGLFFLIDDAFRVGEYVQVGSLRGSVEKISVRSMQLRHHTGPVHTIPFGEIRDLTNFSRDWVIMKLPLRVTFDTDPERVRKLIKKLGQEMMADPELGPKFLEPLKSQGVREMDDSGQVIRVKFMTRPGEQFVLRKTIYAKIRELFEHEGIEFARREVRVRLNNAQGLSEEQQTEIAGAVAEGAVPGAGEPPRR